MEAHHPLLVLTVRWKAAGELAEGRRRPWQRHGSLHDFASDFHAELQGVGARRRSANSVGRGGIEFRSERAVFGSIAPHGPHAADPAVQSGYRIAQQNCLRCHNLGPNGGQMAGRPWMVLSVWATTFTRIISPHTCETLEARTRRLRCPATPDTTTPPCCPWPTTSVHFRRKTPPERIQTMTSADVEAIAGSRSSVVLFLRRAQQYDRLQLQLSIHPARFDDGLHFPRQPGHVARHELARVAHDILFFDHYLGSDDHGAGRGGAEYSWHGHCGHPPPLSIRPRNSRS